MTTEIQKRQPPSARERRFRACLDIQRSQFIAERCVTVAVDFSPRNLPKILVAERRLKASAVPSPQASLRDARLSVLARPWTEVHGYRHRVAPRQTATNKPSPRPSPRPKNEDSEHQRKPKLQIPIAGHWASPMGLRKSARFDVSLLELGAWSFSP